MLGWVFGKKASSQAASTGAAAPAAAAVAAARLPAAPPAPPVDWAQQLSQAEGDDAALLELAGSKAPIDLRQAALQAIASEAVLKTAELAFRDRDRRLARSARQRHAAMAAQRESRAAATGLIESARALAGHALIPLNRLAELDRAWQALDPERLEPAQRSDFAAAMEALSALSRERGDAQLVAERWAARARDASATLQASTAEAAAGTRDRSQLASACDAARGLLASGAGMEATSKPADTLQQALRAAALVDERIAFLEALPDPANDAAADGAHDAVADPRIATQTDADRADPEQRWQAFAPLDDAALRDPLDARFAAWRQARLGAQQAARAQRAEQARSHQRAARQQDVAALDAALEQAGHALTEGHLDAAERHLAEATAMTSRAGIGEAQRARVAATQAHYAGLKGWQHWGGGVAREELVGEAEALAAIGTEAGPRQGPPLSIRERSESIARLRARWKELDRLGGAGGGALWRRFDEALTAAYQPVAAHTAAQRAARELNLAARRQLLDALEATTLPGTPATRPAEAQTEDNAAAATSMAAPDWKPIAQALDRWLAEWRKLGPLEHTVPREQREPLLARTSAALARLEEPLGEARHAAQAVREQLIARARRLADEAASGAPGRDLTGRVRDLQAAWQQHAKAVPLARAAESAAWADFRAAIDAVFSARAAAARAHDEALRANAAEREARDVVAKRLAEAEQARQRAEAEALQQKLALCEALESGDAGTDRATLAERWSALPALRSAWEQALAQRAGLATGKPAPASPAATEALLLQLEEALGIASPPAAQEARRALKLQAMKAALEGRGSAVAARLPATELTTLLLGRSGLDAGQRERLARALEAAAAATRSL